MGYIEVFLNMFAELWQRVSVSIRMMESAYF